ncbi:MAG: hypothetical protein AABW67_02115 [Nanoarchaeota archaeon]
MVSTEYHMLNGESINGNSLDVNCKEGEFIARINGESEDEPKGLFRILGRDREKLTLEQIDCNSLHWRINPGRGTGGFNGDCKLKCKYFEECPIRDYLLLLKSGFE